ncbi:Leucine-rich repeat protein kinase family protein [Arabidopsis thaliana]|uniref:Leucine-rich repeat protein kinase family protein n=1 Tax=Arabidopsis thaliana TaxID=3702 RepID=O22138_ARATH|eukprot:NP_182059.1 Leucine-rich repeat protein kinase family protein [Arabidopsis thaliana]
MVSPLTLFLILFFFFLSSALSSSSSELDILLDIKSSLDPEKRFLTSWTPDADPCSSGSFDGVACDGNRRVANISLQGMGLTGTIPPSIGLLTSLTGLYLHFNSLTGHIPKDISNLPLLTDLYLNVNNLSGEIPPLIGNLDNLQVIQLCYNKLSGSIPTQFGSLKKITVLALQYNQLSGAIPASLGDIDTLTRLDLSFNNLFGPVPVKLAGAPLLEVLDIRNNSFSGFVPSALKRLNNGFQYSNNHGLCGDGFTDLKACTGLNGPNPNRPDPTNPTNFTTVDVKPESADLQRSNCSNNNGGCSSKSLKSSPLGIVMGLIGSILAVAIFGGSTFTWYRRRKQKIGSSLDAMDGRISTEYNFKEVSRRKSSSPLISLEYASGWDPLGRGQSSNNNSALSQEVFESFMFNLEEIERATQSFSEINLLGKSNVSSVYKGILRDGSVAAIKCIAKSSCKSDESEFLKGLKMLTLLKHENLARLRGFCCSKGRGECFLIYEFVPNGNLLQYLDVKDETGEVLEWATRVSIINGIARGIVYLHGENGNKPAIVHQNLSAEKILIDHWYNPSLADSGLHKLFTDDIVFSKLKASAAMGYLAPEYITTGRFTDKSDVYAFGMILLQILSGKSKISHLMILQAVESGRLNEDFMDPNLRKNFPEVEAAQLARLGLLCTHESSNQRPSMEDVIQELNNLAADY